MKAEIVLAQPTALAPPLAEPEAALVLRLREAAITLPGAQERADMLARAQELAGRAEGVKVRKPDDYTVAAELLGEVKGAQRVAKSAFESIPEIKRTIEAWRDQYTKTLDGIEDALKTEMLAWSRAEDARRIEREAKARAEAEATARAEQDRLAKETRDAAAQAKRDGDKAAAKALLEEAKAIAAAPVAVAPVAVESRIPEVAGLRETGRTKGKVGDPIAILKWLLSHPEHVVSLSGTMKPALTFSQSWLDAQAKAGVPIPGLIVWRETGIAAGAR